MRPRAIQLNALDKGKSSSRARYRPFSRDIDLVVDRHERNTTHSPSRPYKPASSKAVYTARIFLGTPGGVEASSAPLEALGGLRRGPYSNLPTGSEGNVRCPLYAGCWI